MSELHQQAINYVYLQVLQKLQCQYSHRQRLALEELIRRIALAAGGYARLGSYRIIIPHNGGRESAQAVSFLRAAQLSLPLRCGQTFSLRIVTCRQAELGEPMLGNLQRLYEVLFMLEDPRVELLLADEHQVQPFDGSDGAWGPLPTAARVDLLMAGQLTGADVRTTFCHLDHQRHARALRRATAWGESVDALALIDPPEQRNQYLGWARRLARGTRLLRQTSATELSAGLLGALGELQHNLGRITSVPPLLKPLNLHDLMVEMLAAPSLPLLQFVGFRLPDLGAAINDADRAHPLLMAHVAGLRAEVVTLLDYADGVEYYLALAVPLLRHRQLPESLLRGALASYSNKRALTLHRKRANLLLQARYGLRETHLVCMLFSPFVDGGAGMARYLQHCHQHTPQALHHVHSALRGEPVPTPVLQWLTETSGLPLGHLQKLYGMARVHVDDDHTLLTRTRLWPTSARGIRGLHPVTGLPALQQGDSPYA